ncbi:unnamed protein product [Lymnaea stagnalis]|uniref:Uncharacterized protein n=1 Tax=Lymnaea stagnalis TaxID=6523 RepID=A0AAV2HQN0_LYMST
MEPVIAKVITLVVLIFLTLLSSVLPYFLVLRGSHSLVSARRRDKIVGYLNCFAGGVFLGTLLLHLLTEGSEEFENYKKYANLDLQLPLFNIFVAAGFFLVAYIEIFMRNCLYTEVPVVTNVEIDVPDASVVSNGYPRRDYGSLRTSPPVTEHQEHHHGDHQHSEDVTQRLMKSEHPNHPASGTVNAGSTEQALNASLDADTRAVSTPTGIRAFLLLVALSFHTIFDGLAVGLQHSASGIWQVFAAISIHKTIIAFCLGLEIFKSEPNRPVRAFLWLCFFSLMSPMGIGLGIFLTAGGVNDGARLLSSSILQGLASGTFLYVTFLELLCVYIGHNSKGEFLSLFFSMTGFVLMTLVKLLDHD